MTDPVINDNDAAPVQRHAEEPDAHGQAALLLIESLLHGLIARSVIEVRDAVEIVGIAAEVKEEIAYDLGDSPATMHRSLMLLDAIRESLSNDVDEAEPTPAGASD